jgi:hypothetical protein
MKGAPVLALLLLDASEPPVDAAVDPLTAPPPPAPEAAAVWVASGLLQAEAKAAMGASNAAKAVARRRRIEGI